MPTPVAISCRRARSPQTQSTFPPNATAYEGYIGIHLQHFPSWAIPSMPPSKCKDGFGLYWYWEEPSWPSTVGWQDHGGSCTSSCHCHYYLQFVRGCPTPLWDCWATQTCRTITLFQLPSHLYHSRHLPLLFPLPLLHLHSYLYRLPLHHPALKKLLLLPAQDGTSIGLIASPCSCHSPSSLEGEYCSGHTHYFQFWVHMLVQGVILAFSLCSCCIGRLLKTLLALLFTKSSKC